LSNAFAPTLIVRRSMKGKTSLGAISPSVSPAAKVVGCVNVSPVGTSFSSVNTSATPFLPAPSNAMSTSSCVPVESWLMKIFAPNNVNVA
jgi:hypothetical protein